MAEPVGPGPPSPPPSPTWTWVELDLHEVVDEMELEAATNYTLKCSSPLPPIFFYHPEPVPSEPSPPPPPKPKKRKGAGAKLDEALEEIVALKMENKRLREGVSAAQAGKRSPSQR